MKFIPGSLGIAVVWSTLVTLGFYFIRKKNLISGKTGLISVGVMYGLCILRLLVPIDFGPSIGITVRGTYTAVYLFFWNERSIGPWSISLWQIFLMIWAVGAALKILHFLYGYFRAMRRIECLPDYCPEQSGRICRLIENRTGKKMECRILCSPVIHMPAGVGLFRRRILMPDITCGDGELYYILMHEFTHFRNGDLFLKFGLQIIDCLFWWNPCIRLLQKEVSQTLEIRCDLTVTKGMDGEGICEYMRVILEMVKSSGQDRRSRTSSFITASLAEGSSALALEERFGVIIGEYGAKKQRQFVFSVVVVMIALLFFFGSYTFMPLPGGDPPIEEIEEDGAISYGPENSYLYI